MRPDFYDLHYFGRGGASAYSVLSRAKEIVAPTPLWVGETGYPTILGGSGFGGLPRTRAAQEAGQAQFLATVAWAAQANGLAPIGVWQLGDLVPAAVPDRTVKPEDPELHYGLFRLDGSAKPAVDTVRSAFDGSVPVSFNNGFEDAIDGGVPARPAFPRRYEWPRGWRWRRWIAAPGPFPHVGSTAPRPINYW